MFKQQSKSDIQSVDFEYLPIDDEHSLLHLRGASLSYLIAIGYQQGQKVFTLQAVAFSLATLSL